MDAFDGMEEIVGVFRAEAAEQLRAISETLLKLEQAGSAAEQQQLATSAFRNAHNVKGAAASLGMGRLQKLVHALEDVLAGIRDGRVSPDAGSIDVLLRAVDVLGEATAHTQPGDEELHDADRRLVETLAGASRTAPASAAPPPPATPSPAPAATPAPAADTSASPAAPTHAEAEADDGTAEWVRVSRAQLDALTAQVGELAESRIRILAAGRRLEARSAELQELTTAAGRPAVRLTRQLARGVVQDADELGKTLAAMQADLKELRTVRVDTIFHSLRRAVRDACRARNVDASFHIEGGDLALDRSIVEALRAPLLHLLRNAVAHGIEPTAERQAAGKPAVGSIALRVQHQGGLASVEVADDGRGIDFAAIERRAIELGRWQPSSGTPSANDLARLLLGSGVSTAKSTDTVAGRGVGMGAVSKSLEDLDGTIAVRSEPGRGTSFVLSFPLTMAAERGVFVRVGGARFAFPRTTVKQVLSFRGAEVSLSSGVASLWRGDRPVPLARLDESLQVRTLDTAPQADEEHAAVMVTSALREVVFVVDEVEGEGEIISRPLGTFLKRVPGVAGVTVSETGMHMILNAADLVASALRPASGGRGAAETGGPDPGRPRVVLVVDDAVTSRLLHERMLSSAGFRVLTAANGAAALAVLRAHACDVVVTDAQMPEMDGFELARAVKNDPALKRIPVILVTALGSDADKRRGLEAGADAYLLKQQLNQRELVQTIEQLA